MVSHVHTFSVQSMVRGYHVYQSVWDATCDDEILPCKREVVNIHDPSSVAITKGTTGIVVGHVRLGHVPRIISPIYSIFIRRGGTISCRANGSRRYSSDLPQGGLEVPCILTFSTPNAREIEKTKKLIESGNAFFLLRFTMKILKQPCHPAT